MRVLLLLTLLLPPFPLPSRAESERAAAKVVSLNGSARVGTRNLEPGDSLAVGEVIVTEEGTGVKLLLSDDTIIDLGPRTTFRVERYEGSGGNREVGMALGTGRARASVRKKLEGKSRIRFRTKASVLAVRGTEWLVEVRGGRETIVVKEGELAAELKGQSKEVLVPGGKQLLVSAGSFQISSLPAQELQRLFNEVTVADRTFFQAVYVGSRDEQIRHLEGRDTVRSLIAGFGADPTVNPGFKGDPPGLLEDTAPPRRDGAPALRRAGSDQFIDIGGNNVSEVDVTVTFDP